MICKLGLKYTSCTPPRKMHSNRPLENMRDGRDRYLIWKELSIFQIPVGYVKTTENLLYFNSVVLSLTK